MSDRALRRILETLERARAAGVDPSELVARSADRGWTDLYLPGGDRRQDAGVRVRDRSVPASGELWDTTGALDLGCGNGGDKHG